MKNFLTFLFLILCGLPAIGLFAIMWVEHDFNYAWDKFVTLVGAAID